MATRGSRMKVGLLSDTHDHLPMIDRALEVFRREGVEAVLHLGDFCSPFAVRRMLEGLKVPLYGVFGNNDGDRVMLKALLGEGVLSSPRLLELGGRRVFLAHELQEELGRALLQGGVDIVAFGHTHRPLLERHGGGLLLNPGECAGWLFGRSTVALLDLEELRAQIVQL